MEPHLFRVLLPAQGAALDKRLVPRQTHGLQLEHRLDLLRGPIQTFQRMEAVQRQGQQSRAGHSLHRQHLGHLGKVAGQGQLVQVPAHSQKLPQSRCLRDRPFAAPVRQHQL